MLRLCARARCASRLAARQAPPPALRLAPRREAARRAQSGASASGTQTRFRIPGPDEVILTVDDEEVAATRDLTHGPRLVQVRAGSG